MALRQADSVPAGETPRSTVARIAIACAAGLVWLMAGTACGADTTGQGPKRDERPKYVTELAKYLANANPRKRSLQLAQGAHLAASIVTIPKGPAPFVVYPDDESTLYVLRGPIEVTIGKESPFAAHVGDFLFVPPATAVRLRSDHNSGKVILHVTRRTGKRAEYDAIR